MKSCFMFGHSNAPRSILPVLESEIENYYSNHGIKNFYIGNRGNFDILAAQALRSVKQRHTDIRMYLLLAYHPAERAIDLREGFDNSYYPPIEETPRFFAILKANQYMVNVADGIICFSEHIGNARNLLEYAQKRHKNEPFPMINIAGKL